MKLKFLTTVIVISVFYSSLGNGVTRTFVPVDRLIAGGAKQYLNQEVIALGYIINTNSEDKTSRLILLPHKDHENLKNFYYTSVGMPVDLKDSVYLEESCVGHYVLVYATVKESKLERIPVLRDVEEIIVIEKNYDQLCQLKESP